MSYYRGDFYSGDPGFFSFLGGLAKKAVGFIPGVGPAISEGLSMIPKGGARSIVKEGAAGLIQRGKGIVLKHPVLSAAGAAGAITGAGILGTKRGRKMIGLGGAKHHRRMNVCNARALRRAIRRAHGFERLARKVLSFTSPRKHKGHMYFKKK